MASISSHSLYFIVPTLFTVGLTVTDGNVSNAELSSSTNSVIKTNYTSIGCGAIAISKLSKNREKLDSFRELTANWNSYGALPFEKQLIDKADNLLFGLEIQPDIFPTGRQSIQFEYEKPNGDYLEFEIYQDKINYLLIKNDKETDGLIDENQLNGLINDFYA